MRNAIILNNSFVPIGRFVGDGFELYPGLGRATGVYAFATGQGEGWTPLRFGIAFGKLGFQGRFALHNRWLRGLFKPYDADEQAARKLMLEGLHNGVEVWACSMAHRSKGKALEGAARELFGAALHLDRAARGSRMKLAMAEWRLNRG